MSLCMRTLVGSALLAIALAGCGGGKSTTTTTTTTTSTTAAPMSESQRESAALPQANVAPVPAGLNCGATQPVWVNLHTKAWHEPGDPYYGRTKNGAYMCASDAAAKGYHAAGAHHADTTAPVTGGKHHKRHNKNGNGMEGAPEATSTPY